jgi:hypothetical protein
MARRGFTPQQIAEWRAAASARAQGRFFRARDGLPEYLAGVSSPVGMKQNQPVLAADKMKSHTILDIADIRDEEGRIRPEFPKTGHGFKPDGRFSAVRSDGKRLLDITYRQGIVQGPYIEYWSNRQVACTGQFHEGKQDGIWRFYCEDGTTLMETARFTEGREVR